LASCIRLSIIIIDLAHAVNQHRSSAATIAVHIEKFVNLLTPLKSKSEYRLKPYLSDFKMIYETLRRLISFLKKFLPQEMLLFRVAGSVAKVVMRQKVMEKFAHFHKEIDELMDILRIKDWEEKVDIERESEQMALELEDMEKEDYEGHLISVDNIVNPTNITGNLESAEAVESYKIADDFDKIQLQQLLIKC